MGWRTLPDKDSLTQQVSAQESSSGTPADVTSREPAARSFDSFLALFEPSHEIACIGRQREAICSIRWGQPCPSYTAHPMDRPTGHATTAGHQVRPPLYFPKQTLVPVLSASRGESKVHRIDATMPLAGKKRGTRKALSCTLHDSKKMYR